MNFRNLTAGWLWKIIEPRAEAAMTRRILQFHEALMERGQIMPPPPPPPPSIQIVLPGDERFVRAGDQLAAVPGKPSNDD